MPRGGKRPGAGRKKSAHSLEDATRKEAMRRLVSRKVRRQLGPMVDAQISNAVGLRYLVVREKTSGKFLRVSDPSAKVLSTEEEIIEVWAKDPSVQAFTDLLNRAIDKPKEQEHEITITHQGDLAIELRRRFARAGKPLPPIPDDETPAS